MTTRKRLERLEAQQPASIDRPPVILKLVDTTEDDVIGVGAGLRSVMRQPRETYDNLIARARPMLATSLAGMPVIMAAIYSDEAQGDV